MVQAAAALQVIRQEQLEVAAAIRCLALSLLLAAGVDGAMERLGRETALREALAGARLDLAVVAQAALEILQAHLQVKVVTAGMAQKHLRILAAAGVGALLRRA